MNTFKTIPDTELLLSTDGWKALENASQQLGINLTELWQKIASKEIILVEAEEMEDLLDTISGLEGLLSAKEEGTTSWEQVKAEAESDD
jgi:ribosome-binding protein aMBF1 (putative translation factor)